MVKRVTPVRLLDSARRFGSEHTDALSHVVRLVIVAAFFVAWQYVPQIPGISHIGNYFNAFFISSPTRVASQLLDILTGRHHSIEIWPYLVPTLEGMGLGTAIGLVIGIGGGLLLSDSVFWAKVFMPIVVALNAMPRIAFIPVIIVLVGPTEAATVIIVVMVVSFVVFFNALEGGRAVPPALLEQSAILGASRRQLLWRIRFPYVLAWSFATLPLAVTFAILTAVTAEIITGVHGVGALIEISADNVNTSLTFAVVIVLSVVSVIIVGALTAVRSRLLHWWGR